MIRCGWMLAGLACLMLACSRPSPTADKPAATSPASAAGDSTVRDTSDAPVVASPGEAADDASKNAFLLPGAFAPDTTIAALRDRFGAAQVKVGDVPGAEGESFHGVILFPDDPAHRAYLYFQDAQALRGLSSVRVIDAGSRWQLDNGIAIGMTLAELVHRNGKPIRYTGLGWDYGGTIQDLGGGALARAQEGAVTRHWRLGVAGDASQANAHDYPLGEATFSSDDPRYPRQGDAIVVDELWVAFPGEDDL